MPKAADDPGIVEVAAGFVCPLGAFTKGDLYRATDPIVRKYPDQFRVPRIFATSRTEPRIEAATAAPGEKRGE